MAYIFVNSPVWTAPDFHDNGSMETGPLLLNYCVTGRCELILNNGNFVYVKDGEISLTERFARQQYVYPRRIYEGIEFFVDMDTVNAQSSWVEAEFDIDFHRLRDLYCLDGGTYIASVTTEIEEVLKKLWSLLDISVPLAIPQMKIYTLALFSLLQNLKEIPPSQACTFFTETGCTFKNQYSGAVALADGNMTMTGGTISGNTASAYNAAGGVLVNGTSSLAMSGGTIADNTAKRGGGVCVRENGTFTMSGGTISGNSTAVDSDTIQQPNAGGGGVFVEDNAAFEMTNGTITGNKTNGMGGGVATAVLSENDTVGGGRFHMTGGTISDNTASCG